MPPISAQSADAVESILQKYGNLLFRICLVMLKDPDDAEDAVQDTLLQYLQKAPVFDSSEHEKAWLIRVASNKCRDHLRFFFHHQHCPLSEVQAQVSNPEDSAILEALMTIPEKFRIVMVLYYVEEYRIAEIADIIHKSDSAVKMRLQKGRRLLEEVYRREYLEYD